MNLLTIENKSGKVKLTDAVTPWSVEKLTEDIGKLFGASAMDQGKDFTAIINAGGEGIDTLEIEINSPGGSIFDGYNIYNEIKSLQERGVVVTATVTGMAASMASVICMACDSVRMVPHARMMIHEASSGYSGNADGMRKQADLLEGISNDIAVIYSNRTGKPLAEIREMMKKETWMTAKEAVKNKFANAVIDIRASASKTTGMSLLSKLFPGNDEAIKIESAIAENDTLRNDISVLQARIGEITSLAEANITLQAEVTGLTEAKASLETALATATADIAAKVIEIEEAKASAGKTATELLAAIGQPEVLQIENTPESNTKTRNEFNNLNAKDKMAFIKKGGKIS